MKYLLLSILMLSATHAMADEAKGHENCSFVKEIRYIHSSPRDKVVVTFEDDFLQATFPVNKDGSMKYKYQFEIDKLRTAMVMNQLACL